MQINIKSQNIRQNFYAKEGKIKRHPEGPYIIQDCIAVYVNSYLREAGVDWNKPEASDIFDRLMDYSEWLEDRFNRGSGSIKTIARLFLRDYSEDLEPEDVVEALTDLKRDLLKVIEGLHLAIDRAQRPRKCKVGVMKRNPPTKK